MSGAEEPVVAGSRGKEAALVLAAYAAVIALVTLPLAFQLAAGTIGEAIVDKQNHIWDIWWAQKGLLGDGRSFLFSDYLSYPPGASLWGANSGFLRYLLAAFLLALTGDVGATYNLIVIGSLLCSCCGGYLVARRLLGDRGVAFFVGLAVAFNPLTMLQLRVGLPELVNLGWAMLFLGALHRLEQRRDGRSAALALLWFVVAATWCWYIGFVLLLLAGLHLLLCVRPWRLLGGSRERRALLLFCSFWASLCGVMLFAGSKVGASDTARQLGEVQAKVARQLAGRWTTIADDGEEASALWLAARQAGVEDRACVHSLELKAATSLDPVRSLAAWSADSAGAAFFPLRWGAVLLLAGVALLRQRGRLIVFLAALIALAAALALGPCLVLDGRLSWSTCGWTPYSLLARLIPELDRLQFPRRILILAALALPLLAGFGLKTLLLSSVAAGRQRLRRRLRLRLLLVALPAVLALAGGLSLLGFPVQRQDTPVPRHYRELAADPSDFAILEVPFVIFGDGLRGRHAPSRNALYQTVHGKRRLDGQVPGYLLQHRSPRDIEQNALLVELRRLQRGEKPAALDDDAAWQRLEQGAVVLHRYGFRQVVLHPEDLHPAAAAACRALLARLLGEPTADSSEPGDPLLIFQIGDRRPGCSSCTHVLCARHRIS